MSTPYEQMSARTEALETAFYALLDVCDQYRETVGTLLADEKSAAGPRPQLVHRLEQLSGRIGQLVGILEDDALTVMLPMLDRLFAVKRAEAGVDI